MKQCKFCRASLPEDALFCPFCEKEQIEKLQLRAPRPKRRRTVLALLLTLALLAGAFGLRRLRHPREPQIFNAGAPVFEMRYTAEDGVSYRLYLTFAETAEDAEPCESIRLPLPESGEGEVVSVLCAVPEGGTLSEGAAFAALIDHVDICAAKLSTSAALEHGEAAYDAGRPFAAASVTLHYDRRSWYNELGWAVHMKNGDVIYLHQFVHVDDRRDVNNAGAPAVELEYAAEDGVCYLLYLSCADTAQEAWPREAILLPRGAGRFVSLLCAVPEGGTLSDGAAFGSLIRQVDLRVGDMSRGLALFERKGADFGTNQSFAAAAVTMDYDERWSRNELLWIIQMKNGDVIYMHQFVVGGSDTPQQEGAG